MKPIIVAEIGINHNGSLAMAKNLIALASNYGAQYVKFQKRNPEVCVPESEKHKRSNTVFGPMEYIEYKRKIEFWKKEYDEIDAYCKKLNIEWFASVWDTDSVRFLDDYLLPFLKVPSACITDTRLLESIKKTDSGVILSTGMSTEKQIDEAFKILGDKIKYLLHTTSSYPTPNEEMNMNKILTLQNRYGNRCKIGFSNHCIDVIYLVQAYVMGAELLEFHITLDRNLPGTDQYASIGPTGFDRIIKHIKNINVGWGTGKMEVQPSEEPICNKLRVYK
jgi:N-acetylneuraminate synthase